MDRGPKLWGEVVLRKYRMIVMMMIMERMKRKRWMKKKGGGMKMDMLLGQELDI